MTVRERFVDATELLLDWAGGGSGATTDGTGCRAMFEFDDDAVTFALPTFANIYISFMLLFKLELENM